MASQCQCTPEATDDTRLLERLTVAEKTGGGVARSIRLVELGGGGDRTSVVTFCFVCRLASRDAVGRAGIECTCKQLCFNFAVWNNRVHAESVWSAHVV